MSSTRLLVLISGNGTNLQALIDSCADKTIPDAQIVQVISNRKDAYGLQRAKEAGIPTCYHNLLKYRKGHSNLSHTEARQSYDKALADIVLQMNPDLVICAGWMHILAPTFLEPLGQMGVEVINLHPALPGQFNGANAIDRAYEAFQQGKITKTGLIIHYVISEVDMGEPIIVKEMKMKSGESLGELQERMHVVEHEVIVEGTNIAIAQLLNKRAASKNRVLTSS